jgi:thiol-disulfide isomerase/thioredoxin
MVNILFLFSFSSMLFSFCRCGPCKKVAPAIEKLSNSHPNAVFLKIDVDQCQVGLKIYLVYLILINP